MDIVDFSKFWDLSENPDQQTCGALKIQGIYMERNGLKVQQLHLIWRGCFDHRFRKISTSAKIFTTGQRPEKQTGLYYLCKTGCHLSSFQGLERRDQREGLNL